MATAFDPTRPSYIENPYPSLARLRRKQPVYWWSELSAWLVTSHSLCSEILSDAERFRADPIHLQGPVEMRSAERRRRQALLGGANRLVSTDPPDHTRLREIVSGAFAYRSLDELRPSIEREVDDLLDAVALDEPFDLVPALARPLPLAAIAEQLGVAERDRAIVIGGAQQVLAAINPLSDEAAYRRGQQALAAIATYLDGVARGSVEVVGGEVLARMVEAHRAQRLSSSEIVALTVDLATAGNQALEMAIGNSVLTLLRHPAQLAELRADPNRMRAGIDELLRFETPTQAMPFIVANDTKLGDEALHAGQKIFVVSGAANRDPEVFPDPDRLDLTRQARRHLAFGAGVHACLGAALARRELEVVLTRVLARFGQLELRGRGISYDAGFMHRGLKSLLVVGR